jgi:hypothetical protein
MATKYRPLPIVQVIEIRPSLWVGWTLLGLVTAITIAIPLILF